MLNGSQGDSDNCKLLARVLWHVFTVNGVVYRFRSRYIHTHTHETRSFRQIGCYSFPGLPDAPTSTHSALTLHAPALGKSSTGQVQHRETHEVCHRGTRSFLFDRAAAITLLGDSHVERIELVSIIVEGRDISRRDEADTARSHTDWT